MLVAAFVVAAAVLAAAALAQAQAPSGLPSAPAPGVAVPAAADTEATPIAKDGCDAGFTQIAGAVFPATRACAGYHETGSPVPVTVDFYAVRFDDQNPREGFAAGAACQTGPPAGVSGSALDSFLTSCPRVPVIWQYSEPPGQPPTWQEVYRSPACTQSGQSQCGPGFVGALAFISGGRVLAVGGDGLYPGREPNAPGRPPPASDPAGHARAWLYQNGQWSEIAPAQLPAISEPDGSQSPMRALTAVDCTPRPAVDGEFCVAGGYRQLWMWHGGHFTQGLDPSSASTDLDRPDGLRYRVRAIRFVPGADTPYRSGYTEYQVYAVTAGCCDTSRSLNHPRMLAFDGKTWHAQIFTMGTNGGGGPGVGPVDLGQNAEPPLTPNPPGGAQTQDQLTDVSPTTAIPDSFYSLAVLRTETASVGSDVSLIASPGGPEQPVEPSSQVLTTRNLFNYDDLSPFLVQLPHTLSNLRLVSGDGDLQFSSCPVSQVGYVVPWCTGQQSWTTGGDGIVDWAVGTFTASGVASSGLPGQAAAYTTTRSGVIAPNPVSCPGGDPTASPTTCHADPNAAEQVKSLSLFDLPSYALNSFVMVGQTGVGWAVGDRGAIFRLGGATQVSPEPNPPALGAAAPVPLSDRSPYDGLRPTATSEPGVVPSLDTRPLETLSAPRWVSGGIPNPSRSQAQEGVTQIVMSRDGREGWAIGSTDAFGKRTTLYHYTGSTWTRCDPDGIPGIKPADPACASLAGLYHYGGGKTPVSLTAVARVPLENGSDPSRANDFELVATGTGYSTRPGGPARQAILRYRTGRWSLDEAAMSQVAQGTAFYTPTSIAFTAPDDGWMTLGFGGGSGVYTLLHYDGRRWRPCMAGPDPACNDPDGRLPLSGRLPKLEVTEVGDRVYLYGSRPAGEGVASGFSQSQNYPLVLVHSRGAKTWSVQGGQDPGCASIQAGQCVPAAGAQQGEVESLSVGRDADDRYEGWAYGCFGNQCSAGGQSGDAIVERLAPDGSMSAWPGGDAVDDYMRASPLAASPGALQLTVSGHQAPAPSLIAQASEGSNSLLRFDGRNSRWSVTPTPWPQTGTYDDWPLGSVRALADDNQGGAWAAISQGSLDNPWFYHYTNKVHEPVFVEIAHPIREPITSAAGGGDGSFWVATASNVLYRYDRLAGWDRVAIPGWDPGRVVTNPSPVYAVAVGPDGQGVAVGRAGRIADLSAAQGLLDAAAGVAGSACGPGSGACGTGRDLHAAAVAPDGSAIVGGDARTLLWRPVGGGFRPIAKPDAAVSAQITGLAMPNAGQAWLTTATGQIFAGQADSSGNWSWRIESQDVAGDSLSQLAGQVTAPLRAIAVDPHGHGFAVGDHGVVLARDAAADPAHPWRRLDTGLLDNLTAVALPAAGGPGALIGGEHGLILSLVGGQFEVAQPADNWDPAAASVAGLGLLPGYRSGDVEAFAAEETGGGIESPNLRSGAILHYSSNPDEPLLDGGAGRVDPLPDSPAPRPAEVSFALFGKQECQAGSQALCPELDGSNEANDAVASRVVDSLLSSAQTPGGPAFSLFTGDGVDAGGIGSGGGGLGVLGTTRTSVDADIAHHRWAELVADPLRAAGLPLFGALGGQDLAPTENCHATCAGTAAVGGSNLPWRQAMARLAGPWGAAGNAPAPDSHGLSFVPVPATGIEGPVVSAPAATGAPGVSAAGAHTHYAFDVRRAGAPIVRVAVVDTSLRMLAGASGEQNPVESQLQWLRGVLCIAGQDQTPADHCSRDPREQAIVVSETPSYSYGPGATSDTLIDGTTFEALLAQYHVNLVVSGRLGWNAVYWTLAPGIHSPCPGDSPPDPAQVPDLSAYKPCGQATSTTPGAGQAVASAQQLAASLTNGALPSAGSNCGGSGPNPTGTIPGVIAASAGGGFGPADGSASGSASQGFWHGYTIVRLDRSGHPRCTIVEQRPVFDWIGLGAVEHTLHPGQHVQLRGFGREPVGLDQPARYDDINSFAITHRYDLLQADPAQPWLARTDPASPYPNHYVPLDPSIGSIEPVTGKVTTGRGNHPRVYAIAILSVGNKAASWPLVFEPRRNYVPPPPVVVPAPPSVPPIHGAAVAAAAPPPAPPALNPPQIGNVSFPALPGLPSLPTLSSAPPPAPVAPAAPPPPPPPSFPNQPPLSLQVSLTQLGNPPSPVPPSAPVVNPAPPSGSAAKKEARQRQAATAKSEEGTGSEAQRAGGDLADGPPSPTGTNAFAGKRQPNAFARHAPQPLQPSLTTLAARAGQPSAWTRDLLYGSALAVAALVLALGFSTVRPTPRRRPPEVPAPVWAPRQRR